MIRVRFDVKVMVGSTSIEAAYEGHTRRRGNMGFVRFGFSKRPNNIYIVCTSMYIGWIF